MVVEVDLMHRVHLTVENDEEEQLSNTEEFNDIMNNIIDDYKDVVINHTNIWRISERVNVWLKAKLNA